MTQVRPARPHTGLTEDGKRIREVLTYSRRGSRLSDAQAEVWERRAEQWWVPDEAVDDPQFSWAERFGREAPLVVEIGSGIGEATAALGRAAPRPQRAGLRGLAARCGRDLPDAGEEGRRPTSGWSASTRSGRWRTCSSRGASPSSGRSSPTRGRSSATSAAGWSTPSSPAWPRAGCGRGRGGGWPPTGRTTPTRWRRSSAPSRCSTAGRTERWADRPRTRFERRGIRAERPPVDLTYRRTTDGA